MIGYHTRSLVSRAKAPKKLNLARVGERRAREGGAEPEPEAMAGLLPGGS